MKEQDKYNKTSIINIKNKLGLEEIFVSGTIIYVRCPFCHSEKGAMKLDISNNTYICKKCEEKGYALSLYAKCKYISNNEAFKKLINSDIDMTTSLNNNVILNYKKEPEELDRIYSNFLNYLDLSPEHTMKLLNLGFTIEEIEKIGFKTIPTKNDIKLKICKKLIDSGIELKGCPGFYIDENFKWNFKSHNGIFIPIVNNGNIESLRIHLDKNYGYDTTDIWFSSGDKNNGCKASNNIMFLFPSNELKLYNDTKNKKDIIIASEMLLAYRLFYRYKNVIVIGIPNVISNKEIKKINRINPIENIYLTMDYHTIKYTCLGLTAILNKSFGADNIKNVFMFNKEEYPKELEEKFMKGSNILENIA